MSVEQAFDVASPGDQFSEVLKSCDVVNTSHDVELNLQKLLGEGWPDGKIVCDISAFGRAGPLARQPASDFEVPALAGLIDTTGDVDVPASRDRSVSHRMSGVPIALSATPTRATHVISPVGCDAVEILDRQAQPATAETINS